MKLFQHLHLFNYVYVLVFGTYQMCDGPIASAAPPKKFNKGGAQPYVDEGT